MKDDEYTRGEFRYDRLLGELAWRISDDGPMKVVPADAIVIERGELPEVKFLPDGKPFAETDGGWGDYSVEAKDTPERLADHARALLSLAEYLREHQPVDEAEVQRVARLVTEIVTAAPNPSGSLLESDGATQLARRLVARGVRVVQP